MNRTFNYGGPLLAICLTLTGLSAAYADTTTTTVTTKTYEQPAFVQPNGSYVVVDPLTGVIRGDYIVGSRVVAGLPLSSNYVVMDKISRRVVGTFDANGNLIDITTAPAASNIIVSVDSHRTALEKQIDAMLTAGQITSMQADRMRADIARLFPATTTTRTVTYNSALEADSGLYSVEARLLPLSSKTYVTKTVSPRFVSVNSQLVLPDNLTYRRMQLEQRMEDEFAFGRLTRDQLDQLKSDSRAIANKDANFRIGGLLTDTNAAILSADLNVLQSKMEQYEANDKAGVQIGTKIIVK
ncbi:MAG: hypothetical protein JST01_24340 [Cyanobacteria bacterium SZAS TMP-1]|nr:hypothetical protein [Cyanobacteria bacterium SZAS TMP-1]